MTVLYLYLYQYQVLRGGIGSVAQGRRGLQRRYLSLPSIKIRARLRPDISLTSSQGAQGALLPRASLSQTGRLTSTAIVPRTCLELKGKDIAAASAWRAYAKEAEHPIGTRASFNDRMESAGFRQERDYAKGRHWVGIQVRHNPEARHGWGGVTNDF